jgi:hypothetical protein
MYRVQNSVGSKGRTVARLALAGALILGGTAALVAPGSAAGTDALNGKVFVDLNNDGIRQTSEVGLSGVAVKVTATDGTSAATTSGANGAYSLALSSIGAGPYRIEYSGWPANFRPGPHGANNGTSVVRTQAGGTQDFGVVDPDTFCQNNPKLVLTCFVSGNAPQDLKTVTEFGVGGAQEVSSHDATKPLPAGAQAATTTVGTVTQTGSVYGTGYDPRSGNLYLGAFAKKYVPFGGGGSGAILVRRANGTITQFFNTGSSANRTPTSPNNWMTDPWTDQIGKVGWGDIDVVDGKLYAVNLEDRNLYVFTLDASGNATGAPTKYPIPANATNPDDSRPFGLGHRGGLIYVGGVDSKQIAGGVPTAWVRTFDPATGTFGAVVTSFGLGFNRGCAYVAQREPTWFEPNPPRDCSPVDGGTTWRAWGKAPATGTTEDPQFGIVRTSVNPQPELSAIEFGTDGAMMLGFRDRYGDQSGRMIPAGTGTNFLGQTVDLWDTSFAFGDTLRLAQTQTGVWTLENNGTSGGVTGTANSGNGPGGGEFYDGDSSLYHAQTFGIAALEGHDETTLGGLAYLPNSDRLVSTAYDVFGRWDLLGVKYLTNTGDAAPKGASSTDLNQQAQAVLQGTYGGNNRNDPRTAIPFGKANGLGDLEVLCDEAPIELGNYVWFDTNGNGLQDSGEPPLAGVTVKLLSATGQTLATAITDANGQYFFASAGAPNLPATPAANIGVVTGGIKPHTAYSITFDSSTANLAAAGITGPISPTTAGAAGATINSDGVSSGGGLPTVKLTTGGAGSNDHTFDQGYVTAVVTTTTTTAPPTSVASATTVAGATTTVSTTAPGASVLGVTTIAQATTVAPSPAGPQVLGVSATRRLALTGADSNRMVFLGIGMIVAGCGVVLLGRRRTA